MNIIDISKLVKWEEVKRSINYFYPDDKNDYSSLFKQIQKFKKVKQEHKCEVIEISTHDDTFYDTKEVTRYYSVSSNMFSLSFRPFKEVASIEVSIDTINHYTLPEILAHFIWEITFYGNEKEMNRKMKNMKETIKNADKKKKKV